MVGSRRWYAYRQRTRLPASGTSGGFPVRVSRRRSAVAALQVDAGGVDAVALAGGLGAVGEDVAEVGAAVLAAHLGAHHAEAAVFDVLDLVGVEGVEEA